MNWKFFVLMAVPVIRGAAASFKAQDINETGKDDLIGISLDYAANLLEAVVNDKKFPTVPAELK